MKAEPLRQVMQPLNLSKEVAEPHLAEMRARMELATEPAAFALGMLTAVYFETAIEIPEEILDRAMFVQISRSNVFGVRRTFAHHCHKLASQKRA